MSKALTAAELGILKEARSYVAQGWTQEVSSKNRYGLVVSPNSPYATQFCLIGSVFRASANFLRKSGPNPSYNDVIDLEDNIFNSLRKTCGMADIAGWNDYPVRTQAEVLALMDSIIKENESVSQT